MEVNNCLIIDHGVKYFELKIIGQERLQPVFGQVLHTPKKLVEILFFTSFMCFFFVLHIFSSFQTKQKRRERVKKNSIFSNFLKLADTLKLLDTLRRVPNFGWSGSFIDRVWLKTPT